MALSRAIIITVSFLLLLHLSEAHQTMSLAGEAASPLAPTIDCGAACEGRCKLSSRPRLCKRACGSCCSQCQCVTPGTSGNLDSCPCYASLTTRDQMRKCP